MCLLLCCIKVYCQRIDTKAVLYKIWRAMYAFVYRHCLPFLFLTGSWQLPKSVGSASTSSFSLTLFSIYSISLPVAFTMLSFFLLSRPISFHLSSSTTLFIFHQDLNIKSLISYWILNFFLISRQIIQTIIQTSVGNLRPSFYYQKREKKEWKKTK